MRNPFVFDFKIQVIAQKPGAAAAKRIYSYESTANFETQNPEQQGKKDFIAQDELKKGGFVWGELERIKADSVHFVFGIRFPSFKREYEALRMAYSYNKKQK